MSPEATAAWNAWCHANIERAVEEWIAPMLTESVGDTLGMKTRETAR
jgi:hypothetical protein